VGAAGRRQVEILRLLADRSTDAEIPQRLVHLADDRSPTTSRSLLSKLDVPSRRAAAHRAAELGILA
jgi:DNA-binding NarL/FixJ family response regulator